MTTKEQVLEAVIMQYTLMVEVEICKGFTNFITLEGYAKDKYVSCLAIDGVPNTINAEISHDIKIITVPLLLKVK